MSSIDQNGEVKPAPGRRRALRMFGLIAIGIGVSALGLHTVAGILPTNTNSKQAIPPAKSSDDTIATGSVSPSLPGGTNQAYENIKVVYFGMATQATGTKQEYIVLQSPVFLDNLLSKIKNNHPVAGPMLSTMQVVINGNPADGNPQLQNNDEVDFIPILGGG